MRPAPIAVRPRVGTERHRTATPSSVRPHGRATGLTHALIKCGSHGGHLQRAPFIPLQPNRGDPGANTGRNSGAALPGAKEDGGAAPAGSSSACRVDRWSRPRGIQWRFMVLAISDRGLRWACLHRQSSRAHPGAAATPSTANHAAPRSKAMSELAAIASPLLRVRLRDSSNTGTSKTRTQDSSRAEQARSMKEVGHDSTDQPQAACLHASQYQGGNDDRGHRAHHRQSAPTHP